MDVEKFMMIYEINRQSNTERILGEEFYKTNKNKGRIIYNNKKILLCQGLFTFKNNMNEHLKIKMILSKDCYNKSCMFKNCSSLLIFKFYNSLKSNDELLNSKFNLDYGYNNNGENKALFPLSEIKLNQEINTDLYKDNFWDNKISVMNEIFCNCSSLIFLPDISKIDTSNIKEMIKIFYNCRNLSSLPDISGWNTNNVIDMNNMFYNCSSLASISDISKWNINNVSNIDNMFKNCISLVSLPDISQWKDNLNNMSHLSDNCFSLKSINDFSSLKTNKYNNKFIMNSDFERKCLIIKLIYEIKGEKKIKIFDEEFVYNNEDNSNIKMIINNKICELVDEYEITDNNLKFLKVKLLILNNENINLSYMFYDCHSLIDFKILLKDEVNSENKNQTNNEINPTVPIKENLPKENIINLDNSYKEITEDYNYQASNNSRLESLINNLSQNSSIPFDEENEEERIINSSANYLSHSNHLTEILYYNNEDFLSNTNCFSSTIRKIVSKKTGVSGNKYMKNCYIFQKNFKKNEKIYIYPTDLSYMFYGCSSLLNISGLSKLKSNNIFNISHMFENCSNLIEIKDIFQLEINEINDISFLFSNCSSLISLPDISKWNIDNVENMSSIFLGCTSLTSIPNISKWNTS